MLENMSGETQLILLIIGLAVLFFVVLSNNKRNKRRERKRRRKNFGESFKEKRKQKKKDNPEK